MHSSQEHRHLPDAERLSALSALIMLVYTSTLFIELPGREITLQLSVIFLSVKIDEQILVAIIAAGFTASGANWLLQDHPAIGKRMAFEHWLLPALTALVVALPLFQLRSGSGWWIAFLFGGALIILVLIAEYIVVDPQDVRQIPAAVGLTAVSFALYLVLASGLRYAGSRLFLSLPALAIAAALVSLRALRLRQPDQWAIQECIVVALLTAQLAAGLHYWPVSPVSYGLALLGLAYAGEQA